MKRVCFVFLSLFGIICFGLPRISVFDPTQATNLSLNNDLIIWQGRKNYAILFFTDWCSSTVSINNVIQQCKNIWTNGSTPIVTWEIKPCVPYTDVVVEVSQGVHDAYLQSFGTALKTWLSGPDGVFGNGDDYHVFLRMGHEMNGNWYPWSPGGPSTTNATTPQAFIAAWQHVMGYMGNLGLGPKQTNPRVEWIWCANNFDAGGNKAETFYPGDQYVDWMATDGYNNIFYSNTQVPNSTFDPIFARFKAISPVLSNTKVFITEWGTNSQTSLTGNVNVIQMKGNWIYQAFRYFADHPEIGLVSYFDIDQANGNDWQIFGGAKGDSTFTSPSTGTVYNVYQEYKLAVQSYTSSIVISTNDSHSLSVQWLVQMAIVVIISFLYC